MMKINDTTISFLESDHIRRFGKEKGTAILRRTETIYQDLLSEADHRSNAAIQNHLQLKFFPTLAYYKALRAENIGQDEALQYVREETHKAANAQKETMRKLGSMPFAYTIFRLGAKKHMRKNFPSKGWKTEWIKCGQKEIHFNLHTCLYWEAAKMYDCPELCCIFCENDDISFSGLLPKIRFERSGTLGTGSPYCDFHFLKA